jgi:hypothetical protein
VALLHRFLMITLAWPDSFLMIMLAWQDSVWGMCAPGPDGAVHTTSAHRQADRWLIIGATLTR